MKRFEKMIGIAMLFFAIGFNLWIYRLEPTATTDPNDNTFQYALVDRTNQIFDYSLKTHNYALLFDHWVPNWAQGYNLPYYYSHVPQILIVATHKLIPFVSLFTYYHWVTYLLLSFFPLSLFLALLITGLSPISAGFGALIATQLSTDGLYGLDPSSFLWRGYGLSSQLYAMIFLPLALAFAYRKKIIPAILFLAATTAGHLGIGIMAFLSIAILGFRDIKKLLLIYGGVFLLLGYWILPILTGGNYHNTSVWDPIWKFDSYGFRIVLKNLFNGDLFDFGRLPILTGLVFLGFFSLLRTKLLNFSFLFVFWILMYFGATTWGSLIYLIPGMSDFHLSRFIVGVHIAGLFLIPMALEKINKTYIKILFVIVVLFVISPQTIKYASYNDALIKRANTNAVVVSTDTKLLITTLLRYQAASPGRVFSGRGGSWGKGFRIAETPMYMHLSTYGIPTVLWLPETWSPNSDTEQYFNEDKEADYNLYNIRYVVTPMDLPKDNIQPFWRPLEAGKTWHLYSVGDLGDVSNLGYVTTGIRPAIVSTDKLNFTNVIRLWIQSDYPKQGVYPELTFDKDYPKTFGLPNFRMIDEANYIVPNGTRHNLFSEVPSYLGTLGDLGDLKITSQTDTADMVFTARVSVPPACSQCLVILKQSFHPSWTATIDGKPAQTITVFPFYIGVTVPEGLPAQAGTHEVIFSYKPSELKVLLLLISLITLISLILPVLLHIRNSRIPTMRQIPLCC